MSRFCTIIISIFIAGCATSYHELSLDPAGPFHIRFVHNKSAQKVTIGIKNTSEAPLCVRAEALSSDSYEMDLWLRNRGSAVKHRDPGFLLPPKEGTIRIAPNEVVFAEHHLAARFLLPPNLGAGLQIKAALRYGTCNGPETQVAVSTWHPI